MPRLALRQVAGRVGLEGAGRARPQEALLRDGEATALPARIWLREAVSAAEGGLGAEEVQRRGAAPVRTAAGAQAGQVGAGQEPEEEVGAAAEDLAAVPSVARRRADGRKTVAPMLRSRPPEYASSGAPWLVRTVLVSSGQE